MHLYLMKPERSFIILWFSEGIIIQFQIITPYNIDEAVSVTIFANSLTRYTIRINLMVSDAVLR